MIHYVSLGKRTKAVGLSPQFKALEINLYIQRFKTTENTVSRLTSCRDTWKFKARTYYCLIYENCAVGPWYFHRFRYICNFITALASGGGSAATLFIIPWTSIPSRLG